MSLQEVRVAADPDARAITWKDLSWFLEGKKFNPEAPLMVATGDVHAPLLPVRGLTFTADGKMVMEL